MNEGSSGSRRHEERWNSATSAATTATLTTAATASGITAAATAALTLGYSWSSTNRD